MRLLIIEDEEAIVEPLKRGLDNAGFAVDAVFDGKSGLETAQINEYDCILLDLNLPEIDGIAVSKKLRKENITTPIIMLTARSQIYDKLEGFDNGADDFVTKPFNLNELVARIRAVIKRNSINKTEHLEFEGNIFTPANNVVKLENNSDIILSNKESAILEYLLRKKGHTVSQEELLEHVWDSEIDTFTETVKTHIKTLRQKVDPDKKIIKTIRGKGYLIG